MRGRGGCGVASCLGMFINARPHHVLLPFLIIAGIVWDLFYYFTPLPLHLHGAESSLFFLPPSLVWNMATDCEAWLNANPVGKCWSIRSCLNALSICLVSFVGNVLVFFLADVVSSFCFDALSWALMSLLCSWSHTLRELLQNKYCKTFIWVLC